MYFFVRNGHKVKEIILAKRENMFNLWCENIHRKYVTSYENGIQKKVRHLRKHFNNHDFEDSRMFALQVLSAVMVDEERTAKNMAAEVTGQGSQGTRM